MLKKILETLRGNKKKTVVIGIIVLLIILSIGTIVLYSNKELSPKERQAKVMELSEASTAAAREGKYQDAAKQQIEAYEYLEDDQDRADQAKYIANSYESAGDYDNSLKWYRESLQYYEALKDEDSIYEAKDNIKRVESYKNPPAQTQSTQPKDGET